MKQMIKDTRWEPKAVVHRIFQLDNDPKHTTELKQNGPSQIPDLNPADN